MEDRFDRMTKTLAQGVHRRDALRWLGGGVIGVMLAPFGLRSARAQGQGQAHRACTELCTNVLPQYRAQCLAACFACSSVDNLCGGPGAFVCCGAGTSCCGGLCTDTSVDPLNCGGCGISCNGGTCVDGTCVAQCPSPQTVCAGVCTDTSLDPNNCGTCGTRCFRTCSDGSKVGTFCVNGVCTTDSGDIGCIADEEPF